MEKILEIIEPINETPTYKLWLRAIRNKIIGSANEALYTYGTHLDREEIKAN